MEWYNFWCCTNERWYRVVHKVYIIFHTTYMSREIAADGKAFESQIAQRAEAKNTGPFLQNAIKV
jgi:hypothetical protein